MHAPRADGGRTGVLPQHFLASVHSCGVARVAGMPRGDAKKPPPRAAAKPEDETAARIEGRFQEFLSTHPEGRIWTPREHDDPRWSIWTLGNSRRLWPRGATREQPGAVQAYVPPPPPNEPPKRQSPDSPPPKAIKRTMQPEELDVIAKELKKKADEVMASKSGPSARIQLGQILLTKDDYIKSIIKEWDKNNSGAIKKGEFCSHLRRLGLRQSTNQLNEVFDSFDVDGGKSLDVKELQRGLQVCQKEARAFATQPDVEAERAAQLNNRAKTARDAAESMRSATKLEMEHHRLQQELTTRANVHLGVLLCKRRVKPGEMVAKWAAESGAHVNTLSKADFRAFCAEMGMSTADVKDVDAIFDSYDDDHGGYLDLEEAKAMIKGLRVVAETANADTRQMERDAIAMRKKATKLAKQVKQMQAEEAAKQLRPPPPPPPHHTK